MENVFPRPPSGIFYVKKDIPADVRHAFGGKSAIWKSLGTKRKAEARAKAPDILDKIEEEIAAARAPVSASIRSDVGMPRERGISSSKSILRREQLLDAIEAWRADTISEAHVAFFNGEAETFADFGLEDMAHSERLYRLQQGKWSEIEEFDERLIDALASRGVAMLADHPALGRIRSDFGDAWHDVESFVRQFRRGKFEGWPEDADDTPAATVHAPTRAAANPAAPTAKMPLGELVDRYITRMNPPDATAVRGYVRRLSEALGKPCVQDVTPAQMDDFAVDLQRFPIIKRPDINAKTFRQILELEARSPSPRRLSKKTRWKWFLAYKKLFDYAVSIGLVATNPVEKVMPKAKGEEEERLFYDADDISLIFSRPLFQGCDRTHTKNGVLWGYREDAGDLMLKDAYYWLPILGLWTGCRLEEMAAAKAADIKQDPDGTWFLDLTGRKLKNRQSQRQVPLHPALLDVGFVKYAEAVQRRGEVYLFPDLPHDPEGALSSSRTFTKWWGMWCARNGGEGSGIATPSKTFHSFRHSFKRACRDAGVGEEIHDLLTGHKGMQVGRGYGQGAGLKVLAEAMAKVSYPTFPALP